MTLHSDLDQLARTLPAGTVTRRNDNSLVISTDLAAASRLTAGLAALGISAHSTDRLLAVCGTAQGTGGERLLARLVPTVNDAALAVVGTLEVLQSALDELHEHGHTEMLSDSLLEHVTGQRVPPQTVAHLCDPQQPWTVSNATIDWITDTAIDQLRDAPFGQPVTGTQQQEILARLVTDRAGVTDVAYTATYYELSKALVHGFDLVETARLLARDTPVTLTRVDRAAGAGRGRQP